MKTGHRTGATRPAVAHTRTVDRDETLSPLSGIVSVPTQVRPTHEQRDAARSLSQRRALLVNGNEGRKIHDHPLCTLHATVRAAYNQAISLKSVAVQILEPDEIRPHPDAHEEKRWKATAPPRLIVGRNSQRRLQEDTWKTRGYVREGRRMPSLLSRLRSVLGASPSCSAAPPEPSIRQSNRVSARRIW